MTEEKTKLIKAVRYLRDGTDPRGRVLAQPDCNKLIGLPPAFHKEVQLIKDPDGKLLYTRTFVAPHFNPRLKVTDYQTMMTLYDASYYTHGSALAFLELAIAEIAGLDIEE